MKKAHIVGGILVIAAAGLIASRAFKKEAPIAPTPDPVVMAEHPQMGSIHLTTDLVGTVEPADMVYIYPKAGGDVTTVNVKPGDMVTAGQVICEIDTKQVASAKNTMDTAKIAWDDAVATLNRMTPLYGSGFVSQQEFEGYQTNAEAKRLQYEAAKINYDNQMEFSHITAPISGRIQQTNMEVHDTVGASTQLAVIAGEAGNNVTFYVTEKVKNNLNTGDELTVIKEGTEYGGTVIEVSNMAEQNIGLFRVKASVADDETMAPGTSVELKVPSESAENVMLIPTHSIYYKGGDAYAYTYDEAQGIIHEAAVETGISGTDTTEIRSGLSLDDLVLTTWTSELKEGTKVTYQAPEQSQAQ